MVKGERHARERESERERVCVCVRERERERVGEKAKPKLPEDGHWCPRGGCGRGHPWAAVRTCVPGCSGLERGGVVFILRFWKWLVDAPPSVPINPYLSVCSPLRWYPLGWAW